jgi:hypothetical protein
MANLLPTQSFLTVNGPVKVEYIEFKGTITLSDGVTTQTGVDDADTFDSKMVAPKFVIVTSQDDDADIAWQHTISGKRVTLTSTGASADDISCIVIGH